MQLLVFFSVGSAETLTSQFLKTYQAISMPSRVRLQKHHQNPRKACCNELPSGSEPCFNVEV